MNKIKISFLAFLSLIGSVFVVQPAQAAAASVGCRAVLENTRAVWSTNDGYSYNKGNYCMGGGNNRLLYMKFQSDGNLVIYEVVTGRAIWASNTQHTGNILVFQRDGNVVIYNIYGRPVWSLNVSPYRTKYDMIVTDYDLRARYNYAGVYANRTF